MRRPRSPLARWCTGFALTAGIVCGLASGASAHDGLASTDPKAGSTIEQPISEVTLEFPFAVVDNVQLTLVDPDEQTIESTTTIVSPTVARIEFAPLDRKGQYIVRYTATVVEDDHLLIGAMSFRYGSAGNGLSAAAWVVLIVGSAVILAGGIAVSVRNQRSMRESPTTPTLTH